MHGETYTVSGLTALFALGLCLAIVIERILELVKSAYDVIDGRLNWCEFWDERAKATREYLERRLRVFEYVDVKEAAGLLRRFNDRLLNSTSADNGGVPVICGDLVRTMWVRIGSKVLGILIGIWFAYRFRIDFLSVLETGGAETAPFQGDKAWVTGVFLGLGAGPLHKIITRLEQKREQRLALQKGGA